MSAILAVLLAVQGGGGWPQWRGPRATGSVEGGRYPERWETPAWTAPLPGKGGSTPVVLGERIYVTAPSEGQDAVLAFDLDGKPVWTAALGPLSAAKHKTLGSSCNASPAADAGGVYAYFRSGRLAALDLDGKVRWTVDVVERWGAEKLFWDQGSSPVLTERHVVLARMHGGESWLAAFEKSTGALAWKVDRTRRVPIENDNGYATPIVFAHEGKAALLVWGADLLSAHDAADGSVLWSCEGFNPEGTGYWPGIASPVIAGGTIVVPVGRDDRAGQARLHGIRPGGSRAWKREDLGVFCASPAEYRGRVYLLRHRGEVVCLDPADGKTVWTASLPKSAAAYYASPAVGAGVLYAAREDGVVFTARVGDAFELLGEQKLGERVVASPVPAAGRLLLRGDARLFGVVGN